MDIKKEINLSHRNVLFMSGFFAAFLYLILFGYETLVFTNVNWIYNSYNDINQHYLGWVYYRNSDWAFPLGVFSGLTGDLKSSIVYTDSIPLFAIIFKIFRDFLPAHFQYFGLFTFISTILQSVVGCELIYRVTRRAVASFISSFFFLSASVVGQRMFEHTSLTCHAIILIAILFFIENDEKRKKSMHMKWNILLLFAVFIHAYFVPMVLGFELFYYIKENKAKEWFVTAVRIIGSICITLVAMYVVGYFYGANYSSEQSWLWQFGISLNAFWNSNGHSLLSMICGNTNNEWNLEEGYAYMGAGMMVLCLLASIFVLKGRKKYIKNKKIICMLVLMIVFAIVSTIPTIRWNWDYVITLPLPSFIKSLLGIFRSNGRFIWPTFYMVMVVTCVVIIRNYPRKAAAILFIGVLLQVVDLMPFYGQISSSLKERVKEEYVLEMVDYIPENIDCLMLMGEVNSEDLNGFDFEQTVNLGNFAAERNMTINDFYIARKDEATISDKRSFELERLYMDDVGDNDIYVFPTIPYKLMLTNKELNFYSFDNMIFAVKTPIDGKKTCDIHKGINVVEAEGYVDIRLDTFEATTVSQVEKATAMPGHCIYKEIEIPKGDYKLVVTGEVLGELGIGLSGDDAEYLVLEKNENSVVIDMTILLDTVAIVQLFNSGNEPIVIDGLTISQ